MKPMKRVSLICSFQKRGLQNPCNLQKCTTPSGELAAYWLCWSPNLYLMPPAKILIIPWNIWNISSGFKFWVSLVLQKSIFCSHAYQNITVCRLDEMKYINKWLWSVVQVHVPVQRETENTKARSNIFTTGWLKKHSKYKHILAEFLIWGSLQHNCRKTKKPVITPGWVPQVHTRMSSSGSHQHFTDRGW